MTTIPGFDLTEQLVDAERTIVYRGKRQSDGQSVIVKTNANEYPSPAEIARLKHELEFSRNLNIPGTIRALDLVQHGSQSWLVVEDVGGVALKDLLTANSVGVEHVLQIGIQIAKVLGELHQRNIIHRDIKPHNLIVNAKTWETRVTDFEHATVLDRETQAITSPGHLEGTLAYMSPEQTGRMNRDIDYRTDFYSLGVTLYQALAGRLPFDAHDPMEWVHCHIARTPEPPHAHNPVLPVGISAIVMKLMEKTAEDRYQSAFGLRHDLEQALERIRSGESLDDFIPARHDASEKFQIPQQLYGRDNEVAALLKVFKRVARGNTEMMLVCGYSGIGKSALVNEVQKPIVEERGNFTSGKFDQFERGVPYSAIIRAFTELLRQLLTQDEDAITDWRRDLKSALGVNGQVVVDVIPELELIVGEQPPVQPLPATESQNRFKLVFQDFVGVFAQASHPLVVFLDDLQWADAASLQMIRTFMTDPDNSYLLILGAYRDNEVDDAHPLMLMLGELEKAELHVETLTLGPLSTEHLTDLVSGVVRTDAATARPLADILMSKTGGNPFFANIFLKSLHQEDLLSFDAENGCWAWDAGKIEAKAFTDNVVEFMADKIQTLPEETRNSLQRAACLGNLFDLRELAVIEERSPRETAKALWEAVRDGLVQSPNADLRHYAEFTDEEAARTEINCRFAHDRVQQAAYSLVTEEDRPAEHLRIGRLLLANTNDDDLDDRIFEITRHLNTGRELITEIGEREELVRLNGIAGRKAKLSSAYESALNHFTLATDWLRGDAWSSDYDHTFGLYKDRIECEFLCSNPEAAEKLVQVAIEKAANNINLAAIVGIQQEAYANLGQLEQSIKTGLAGLKRFGVDMEMTPAMEAIMAEVGLTNENLGDRTIPSLVDSPTLSDAEQSAIMKMLMYLIPPAYYLGNSQLMTLVALKSVNISLKHGNAEASSYGYALWGMVLGAAFGDYKTGLAYGELGLKVNEKFKNEELRCKVQFVYGVFIQHWRRPLRDALPHLKEVYQAGLESGDVIYGGWMPFNYANYLALSGEPLRDVCKEFQKYVGFMKWTGDMLRYDAYMTSHQFFMCLRGATRDRFSFSDDSFDEDAVMQNFKDSGYPIGMLWTHILKAYTHVIFHDHQSALNHSRQAAEMMQALFATYYVAKANFVHSLALIGMIEQTAEGEREELEKVLEANITQLKAWAESCPENYLHMLHLVEAEQARATGDKQAAGDLYDKAIRSARDTGFVMDEALANELAARCFLAQDRKNIAKTYLIESRHAWERWGATTKVIDLETKHSALLPKTGQKKSSFDSSSTISNTGRSQSGEVMFDLSTVAKAAQTLSGEINLESLLRKFMRLLLENAGAQDGCLILETDGTLAVQARAGIVEDEEVMQTTPVEEAGKLPLSMVNYVARTRKEVVLDNAAAEGLFTADPDIVAREVKSALCAPIIHQGKLIGVLYLENNLAPAVFTAERLKVLNMLSSQAAISIENAMVYHTLEQRVEERTHELQAKNVELSQTLDKLKETQQQLIMQEKMASLGLLTAGIAHEIKNPLNFITNFSALSVGLVDELEEELKPSLEKLPADTGEIVDEILTDLKSNCTKINDHGKRADSIVLGMVSASRGKVGEKESANLNTLVENAANLAYEGLRASDPTFNISLEREFDSTLPALKVVTADLRRVLLNIVNNAAYAATDHKEKNPDADFTPTVKVGTKKDGDHAVIQIRDNGTGIPDDAKEKIFNPFFTTKPTGKGTGLGLSICYDIVKSHGGEISVDSEAGDYTEFTIRLPISAA